MRTCRVCKSDKPLDEFYKHPFGKDGRDTRCIECTKEAVKVHRSERLEYYRAYDRQRAKDPKRVAQRAAYQKTWRGPRHEPDPVKRAARVAVGNAVRDGRLVKPPECEVCATPCDPHGHHDDYSKPLEVIWCCTACHALIHAYWRAKGRIAA